MPAGDRGQKQLVAASPQQAQPVKQQAQRASPPSAQSNGALSQSFDSRSMALSQKNRQPPQPPQNRQPPQPPQTQADKNSSPNALRTSVDAAISNVDRALSEMHKQELDRLKARMEVRPFFLASL